MRIFILGKYTHRLSPIKDNKKYTYPPPIYLFKSLYALTIHFFISAMSNLNSQDLYSYGALL
jgi:hypothetical protein